MYSRRIVLKTTLNMRELGGYRTVDGGVTQYGRFLRSDNPHLLKSDETDYLISYGVTSAIDLRNKSETLHRPNIFSTIDSVKYYNLPFYPIDEHDELYSENTKLDYVEFVKISLSIGNIFNTMLKHIKGATIYNCTAGKDRTGIVTALLFMLAGVPETDIIADYQVSFTYLKPAVSALLVLYPDMPMHLMTSEPHLMESFIEYINGFADNERSGVRNFLIDSGIASPDLDILRDKLLVQ